MRYVTPKKRFGQHYLKDESVLEGIVAEFRERYAGGPVLEIGPGMGALTRHLVPVFGDDLWLVEVDARCSEYLRGAFPGLSQHLLQEDFLRLDFGKLPGGPLSVIGNFPYNISSQIVFRLIGHADRVPLVVGMFQREVAARLAAPPGSRTYGAISVLAQVWYDMRLAFDIPPDRFDPPPKVMSSVLVMERRGETDAAVEDPVFARLVKAAFGMRRKKLSNALAGVLEGRQLPGDFAGKRAEALSPADYIYLTHWFLGNG